MFQFANTSSMDVILLESFAAGWSSLRGETMEATRAEILRRFWRGAFELPEGAGISWTIRRPTEEAVAIRFHAGDGLSPLGRNEVLRDCIIKPGPRPAWRDWSLNSAMADVSHDPFGCALMNASSSDTNGETAFQHAYRLLEDCPFELYGAHQQMVLRSIGFPTDRLFNYFERIAPNGTNPVRLIDANDVSQPVASSAETQICDGLRVPEPPAFQKKLRRQSPQDYRIPGLDLDRKVFSNADVKSLVETVQRPLKDLNGAEVTGFDLFRAEQDLTQRLNQACQGWEWSASYWTDPSSSDRKTTLKSALSACDRLSRMLLVDWDVSDGVATRKSATPLSGPDLYAPDPDAGEVLLVDDLQRALEPYLDDSVIDIRWAVTPSEWPAALIGNVTRLADVLGQVIRAEQGANKTREKLRSDKALNDFLADLIGIFEASFALKVSQRDDGPWARFASEVLSRQPALQAWNQEAMRTSIANRTKAYAKK